MRSTEMHVGEHLHGYVRIMSFAPKKSSGGGGEVGVGIKVVSVHV